MLGYLLLICSLLATNAVGHMVMSEPPPINYKTSPYYDVSKADFDYTAPLSQSGSNYPCRGMLKHLGTPVAQSVRTYSPGGTYELKFDGSATHAGGSCQVSLSYDRGSTWRAFKSYIGGCVGIQPGGSQTFTFRIPDDAPGGEALFGWTWFNNMGNREMYMNCAVVTIDAPKKMVKRNLSGPPMFLANIGNGCSTPAGTDIVFPDPGSDVQYGGDASKRASPIGNCGAFVAPPPDTGNNGGGADNGSGNGGGNTGGGNTGGDSPPPDDDLPFSSPPHPEPSPEPSFASPEPIPDTRTPDTPPLPTPGNPTPPFPDPLPPVDNGNGNADGDGTQGGGNNNGINGGGDNTNNNNNNPNFGGPGLGDDSGSGGGETEGIFGPGEVSSKDCDYWRSQGYWCNGATKTLRLDPGVWMNYRGAFATAAFWWVLFG